MTYTGRTCRTRRLFRCVDRLILALTACCAVRPREGWLPVDIDCPAFFVSSNVQHVLLQHLDSAYSCHEGTTPMSMSCGFLFDGGTRETTVVEQTSLQSSS